MIRSGKTVASTLATLLVAGTCGIASAQTTQPSDPHSPPSQQPPGADKSPSTTTDKQAAQQEKFDREKVTLKDRVQEQIDAADANIDALKRMSQNDKGQTKKRDDDMQKKLSTLRDHSQANLDKIDKATVNDWSGVKPVVERDINAMNTELKQVAVVTKIQPPTTGAANKQPPNQ